MLTGEIRHDPEVYAIRAELATTSQAINSEAMDVMESGAILVASLVGAVAFAGRFAKNPARKRSLVASGLSVGVAVYNSYRYGQAQAVSDHLIEQERSLHEKHEAILDSEQRAHL